MALCRVLLKTYGPHDVLLLASLFAMSDKNLEGYYKVKVEFQLPSFLANMFGKPKPGNLSIPGKTTIPLEASKNIYALFLMHY